MYYEIWYVYWRYKFLIDGIEPFAQALLFFLKQHILRKLIILAEHLFNIAMVLNNVEHPQDPSAHDMTTFYRFPGSELFYHDKFHVSLSLILVCPSFHIWLQIKASPNISIPYAIAFVLVTTAILCDILTTFSRRFNLVLYLACFISFARPNVLRKMSLIFCVLWLCRWRIFFAAI